jgi:hypothetical protein
MDKILTINNWKSLTEYNHFNITDYIESGGEAPYYAYRIEGSKPICTILIHRKMKPDGSVTVQVWDERTNRLQREGVIPLSQIRTVKAFKEVLEGDKWLR